MPPSHQLIRNRRRPGCDSRALWRLALLGSLVAVVSMFTLAAVPRAAAQDVLDVYRARRMNSRAAQESLIRMRPQPLMPLLPDSNPRSDADGRSQAKEPSIVVFHTRRIPKFARGWFEEQFADIEWAYDGGNTLAPLDTMFTREIRARMEHAFGAPTQTLADRGPLRGLRLNEYVQFEYWFLVNGDMPFIIMDVNGPFERGVVVSGEARHRDVLIEIRDQLLEPILASGKKSPFADYFYEIDLQEWYLTGFDGEQFFLNPINARSVNPGRPSPPDTSARDNREPGSSSN